MFEVVLFAVGVALLVATLRLLQSARRHRRHRRHTRAVSQQGYRWIAYTGALRRD